MDASNNNDSQGLISDCHWDTKEGLVENPQEKIDQLAFNDNYGRKAKSSIQFEVNLPKSCYEKDEYRALHQDTISRFEIGDWNGRFEMLMVVAKQGSGGRGSAPPYASKNRNTKTNRLGLTDDGSWVETDFFPVDVIETKDSATAFRGNREKQRIKQWISTTIMKSMRRISQTVENSNPESYLKP
ncbi:hypothetical protein BY996DRAFT_6472738 [Phakopsora pachyrhizi]|nr:hypothetical protein BY996DRAFT_6472738 [Phakopsora pachyrhizi]